MLNIFISYSHFDSIFVENFKRHTVSLKNSVTFWDDSKILAGQIWLKEIDPALQKADLAILS